MANISCFWSVFARAWAEYAEMVTLLLTYFFLNHSSPKSKAQLHDHFKAQVILSFQHHGVDYCQPQILLRPLGMTILVVTHLINQA